MGHKEVGWESSREGRKGEEWNDEGMEGGKSRGRIVMS